MARPAGWRENHQNVPYSAWEETNAWGPGLGARPSGEGTSWLPGSLLRARTSLAPAWTTPHPFVQKYPSAPWLSGQCPAGCSGGSPVLKQLAQQPQVWPMVGAGQPQSFCPRFSPWARVCADRLQLVREWAFNSTELIPDTISGCLPQLHCQDPYS